MAFLVHAFSLEDSYRVCRVKNDTSAPISFPPEIGAAAPLHRRRPRRNRCEHERDERVVARKRETEEAPGGLIAAHHVESLELAQQPARRAEITERARAFLRACPPFPFDAGMIDAEAGVPEHAQRDGDERGEQHLARGADVIADEHHDRERDREVIGVALLEAERAWLQAEPVLQDQGAQDGRGADRRDRDRRRRHRPGPDHADRHLAHADAACSSSTLYPIDVPHRSLPHITMQRRQWYGAVDPLRPAAMIAPVKPLWRNW